MIDVVKSEFKYKKELSVTIYIKTIGQSLKNGKRHLYADDTIMHAIDLTVDLALLKLIRFYSYEGIPC